MRWAGFRSSRACAAADVGDAEGGHEGLAHEVRVLALLCTLHAKLVTHCGPTVEIRWRHRPSGYFWIAVCNLSSHNASFIEAKA